MPATRPSVIPRPIWRIVVALFAALTRGLYLIRLFPKLLPLFSKFKPSGFVRLPVGLHRTPAAVIGESAVKFGRHSIAR
jgi:hypothetical protein